MERREMDRISRVSRIYEHASSNHSVAAILDALDAQSKSEVAASV